MPDRQILQKKDHNQTHSFFNRIGLVERIIIVLFVGTLPGIFTPEAKFIALFGTNAGDETRQKIRKRSDRTQQLPQI